MSIIKVDYGELGGMPSNVDYQTFENNQSDVTWEIPFTPKMMMIRLTKTGLTDVYLYWSELNPTQSLMLYYYNGAPVVYWHALCSSDGYSPVIHSISGGTVTVKFSGATGYNLYCVAEE